MKKLLVSTVLIITAMGAFGQQKGSSGSGSGHEQPSGGGGYQQPTQMQSRTENYQAPAQQLRTQNYQQPAQQQPTQQSQKAAPSQQPAASSSSKNGSAKAEETNKHSKDTIHKGTEQQKKYLSGEWKCPQCGRTFITKPGKGLCPDDGTPLVKVMAAK